MNKYFQLNWKLKFAWGLLINLSTFGWGAQGESAVIRPALVKWSIEFAETLDQRLNLAADTGDILLHVWRAEGVESRVLTSRGEERLRVKETIRAISRDGKHVFLDAGVRDLRDDRMASDKLPVAKKGELVMASPSFKYLAVIPAHEGGHRPKNPSLKIFLRNGTLESDLSDVLSRAIGEESLKGMNYQYYGEFLDDEHLLLYLQMADSSKLIQIGLRPGTSNPRWVVSAPMLTGGRPILKVTKSRIFLHVDRNTFESGRWNRSSKLCAYSLEGGQLWCRDAFISAAFEVSSTGNVVVVTQKSMERDSRGLPLYDKYKTIVLDGTRGDAVWSTKYLGEPVHIEGDLLISLSAENIFISHIAERKTVARKLPREMHGAAHSSWWEKIRFDSRRKQLVLVNARRLLAISLEPEIE